MVMPPMCERKESAKEKFAFALLELINKKPLDKVTVTDITEVADLTRQTFYRNFKDKYDLVNWYFEKLCMQSFREMGVSCTLEEGLIKKFTFIKSERRFFTEAFLQKDCNSLVEYDYECIYEFYQNILKKKLPFVSEDFDFLLRMYCRGSIQMTVEWVRQGMQQNIEKIVSLLLESMPDRLKPYLMERNKEY